MTSVGNNCRGLIIFSERELLFTFAICYRPSVCLSSVTFVHPTQRCEIFGNISTPFGTLSLLHWHSLQILRRSSQGTPPSGGLNARGEAKCSGFWHFEGYISQTVQDCRYVRKIYDRKSYMSFRLVPRSVTLNDLERRNGPYFALFYRIW